MAVWGGIPECSDANRAMTVETRGDSTDNSVRCRLPALEVRPTPQACGRSASMQQAADRVQENPKQTARSPWKACSQPGKSSRSQGCPSLAAAGAGGTVSPTLPTGLRERAPHREVWSKDEQNEDVRVKKSGYREMQMRGKSDALF